MNGFVNIQVLKKEIVSSSDLSRWIATVWKVDESEQDDIKRILDGKVYIISIICKKPNYAVGAGAKLSFGKKKPAGKR